MLHRHAVFAVPALAVLAILISGCATSRVTPVPQAAVQAPAAPSTSPKRICLVENARVKGNFLEAYRSALSANGYDVEVFPKTPPSSQCQLTTRYLAYWGWDVVTYLQYAELRVYRDGKLAGRAEFKARSSRFVDTEATLRKLVDQLLPQ